MLLLTAIPSLIANLYLGLAPELRGQMLLPLASPNLDLLLLFAGILLIYVEFHRPGVVLPGALGTVLVLVSLYAFNQFPIRPTALLLIVTAFTLIALELKFASFGLFTAAGIAALTLGVLTLIDSPQPELRIDPTIAVALCVSFGVLTAVLLRLAIRARRQKTLIGPAALVGYPATTMEPIGTKAGEPVGHILVQGEIWQATAITPIPEKQPVRVTGHHGAVLEVELQR